MNHDLIEARLREWLAEEEAIAADFRTIAARHDRSREDELSLLDTAIRAEATARRIREALGEQ